MTQYVNVPQYMTGDYSENGCIGEKMEKTEAEKIYGTKINTLESWEEGFEKKATCTKSCEIRQKHGVVCQHNSKSNISEIYDSDDISDSEESMAMWGY